jgi:membrane protease YdiL (CAAX protease family)
MDPTHDELDGERTEDPHGPGRMDLRADLRLAAQCFWSPEGIAGTIAVLVSVVMWLRFARRPSGEVSSEIRYWISHVVGLVIIPLLLAVFGLRMSLRDLGLGLGRARVWGPFIGTCTVLVLPAIAWAGRQGDFRAFYPMWDGARLSPSNFLLHQLVMFTVIFANEFFFRGFMVNTFAKRMPPSAAIVCAMVPYAWGHAAKPPAEFVSSVLAGLGLGIVVWRGRSIWPGVVLHCIVSLTIDCFGAPAMAAQVPGWLLGLVGVGP